MTKEADRHEKCSKRHVKRVTSHLAQKTFDALTKSYSLGSLRIVSLPYMWFNPVVIQYKVLLLRADELVLLQKAKTHSESVAVLCRSHHVDVMARDRLTEVDVEIHLLRYFW